MTNNDILSKINKLYPRKNESYYMINGKVFIQDEKGYSKGVFGRINLLKLANDGIVEIELYQVPKVIVLQ